MKNKRKNISNKIKLAIPLVLILSVLIVFFGNNNSNNSNRGVPEALSGDLGRANKCETEIVKAFDKNETLKLSKQVQNTKLIWKDKKYETFVLDCPNEEESFNKVFLLTNSEGKIIFSMTDERFDKAEIKDINKDSLAELVVAHGNSGNCFNCQGQSVFQITNDAVKNLLSDLPKPEGSEYANVWLSDINNDGIEDIMLRDSSWEMHEGFFHSNSPSHTQILTWNDGEYRLDGEMFSKFYLNQINERNKEITKLLKGKNTGLNDIVSLAIENYWDYQEIGKNDEGYANFILQTNLETLPKTITISDSDKIWLLGIRNEIEKEYKEARPTITPLY
ncbi:MAG: hypothetical protein PHD49_02395 [Candidatus Shapirobacteria bacterium]|nr:hypothetical protein [Candidatus Shapirobacteria bacterium]